MARTKSVARPRYYCDPKLKPVAAVAAVKESKLLDALWWTSPRPRYAAGGEVDAPMPKELEIEDVRKVSLPLSQEDYLMLKAFSEQSPSSSNGDRKMAGVCPAFCDLATLAMTKLGVDPDALMLEMRLRKMLLCEPGETFEIHGDSKQDEKHMFATMVLQLPTESGHEGGELEVRDGKDSVKFDFSASSSKGYFQTVFYSDCEYTLAEVTSGTKVCLVFSLVMSNQKMIDVEPERVSDFISAVGGVHSLMKEWAEGEDMTQGKRDPLLAIPLSHSYSINSLSFSGLKGHDRVVASLVLSCSRFLDVHLAMLIKKATSETDDDDAYSLSNWISTDDQEVEHFNLSSFDIRQAVMAIDASDEEDASDKEEGEASSCDIDGRAVIVVWPHAQRMHAICSLLSVESASGWFEKRYEVDPSDASEIWDCYVARRLSNIVYNSPSSSDLIRSIVEQSIKLNNPNTAAWIIKDVGVGCFEWGELLVAATQRFGWDEWPCLKELIEELASKWSVESKEWLPVVGFARRLKAVRLRAEAAWIVKRLLSYGDGTLPGPPTVELLASLGSLAASLGLQEETRQILSIAPAVYIRLSYDFPVECLELVLKDWGDLGFELVDRFWRDFFKLREEAWRGSSYDLYKQDCRRSFHKFYDFVLRLELDGCREEALGIVRKHISHTALEVYRGAEELESHDVMVLLLSFDERFHDVVRNARLSAWHQECVIHNMKHGSGLLGLKENEKLAKLFSELLLRLINQGQINEVVMEAAIWFGDEYMIRSAVRRLMEKPEWRLDEDDPVIEIVKTWSLATKDEFKEVVDSRIRFLKCGDFKDSSKRRNRNPRTERAENEEQIKRLKSMFSH